MATAFVVIRDGEIVGVYTSMSRAIERGLDGEQPSEDEAEEIRELEIDN